MKHYESIPEKRSGSILPIVATGLAGIVLGGGTVEASHSPNMFTDWSNDHNSMFVSEDSHNFDPITKTLSASTPQTDIQYETYKESAVYSRNLRVQLNGNEITLSERLWSNPEIPALTDGKGNSYLTDDPVQVPEMIAAGFKPMRLHYPSSLTRPSYCIGV